MQFGKGNEEQRNFTSAELAQIFCCDMQYLYFLLDKAGIKKYQIYATYTYSDYLHLKDYIEKNKTHAISPESGNIEELHPLVTDKRWLKITCFPTKEEITPKCFMEA